LTVSSLMIETLLDIPITNDINFAWNSDDGLYIFCFTFCSGMSELLLDILFTGNAQTYLGYYHRNNEFVLLARAQSTRCCTLPRFWPTVSQHALCSISNNVSGPRIVDDIWQLHVTRNFLENELPFFLKNVPLGKREKLSLLMTEYLQFLADYSSDF